MKTALVFGAGGFIGSHMVKRLKSEGYWVRGVDLKEPEFAKSEADEFVYGDLTDPDFMDRVCTFKGYLGNFYYSVPQNMVKPFDELYQFAADMGGAGYIFTGENDADIMRNSALINLNLVSQRHPAKKIFYSSSACMYPEHNQLDPNNPNCEEISAYPANPDSEYGWEKLFSERLFLANNRNYSLEFDAKIARYHNIYGPYGTFDGGKEKAPAALCRKVIEAEEGGSIDIWGDGEQTRSFLYIDDCIDATRALMQSKKTGPYNIGSEEMVTINQLAKLIIKISGKKLSINHIDGPLGVRGRSSHNRLIEADLGWKPSVTLEMGITALYFWITTKIK